MTQPIERILLTTTRQPIEEFLRLQPPQQQLEEEAEVGASTCHIGGGVDDVTQKELLMLEDRPPEETGCMASAAAMAVAVAPHYNPPPPPASSSSVVDRHESKTGGGSITATAERQQAQQQQEHNQSVVIVARVKVSETRESSFFVPLSLLELRESEMKQTAESYTVSNTKWNGSRLHVMYHKHYQHQDQRQKDTKKLESDKQEAGQNQKEVDEAVIIRLDPAAFMKECNLSHNFQWTVELTDMMQMYYEEGGLKVPALDDGGGGKGMKGDHVLLALEYLGILYRPHQLQFGNATTYNEVKRWSVYLTARDDLANHILSCMGETAATKTTKIANAGNGSEAVDSNNKTNQHHQPQREQFAFCICPDETDRKQTTSAPVLATSLIRPSTVYDFFSSSSAAEDMRTDFCSYLRLMANKIQKPRLGYNNNNRLHVKFIKPNSASHCNYWIISIRRSNISSSVLGGGGCSRSVMNTSTLTGVTNTTSSSSNVLLNKDHHKESLPYPLDEMVEEELKQGTLERLIEEAQERTTQKKLKERRQHQHYNNMYNKVCSPTSPLSGTSPRHVTEYPHHNDPGDNCNDDDFQDLVQAATQQETHGGIDCKKREAPSPPVVTATAPVPTSGENNRENPSCNEDAAPNKDQSGAMDSSNAAAPQQLPPASPPTPPRPPTTTSTAAATTSPTTGNAAAKHRQKKSTTKRRAVTSTAKPSSGPSHSRITVTDDNPAAPVRVVRASESEQSVTSALTGPYFYETEDDDELSSVVIMPTHPRSSKDRHLLRSPTAASSPRRYRAWLQNKGRKTKTKGDSGGISSRVRALLDDATDLDDATTSLPQLSEAGAEGDGADPIMYWDWVSESICHFPRTLLNESTTAKQPPIDSGTAEEEEEEEEEGRSSEGNPSKQEGKSTNNVMSVEAIVGNAASDIFRDVELQALKFFQNKACGADDGGKQPSRRLSTSEEEEEEEEDYSITTEEEQQSGSTSKPEMRQKYRDLVVMEESETVSSASERRTRARRTPPPAAAVTSRTTSPHRVKDRLQAIQEHHLRQRRRNDPLSSPRGRQGVDAGPEKEVILSSSRLLHSSSPESPESADSSTSFSTEESGPEESAPSMPRKKNTGNRRKLNVRFQLFRRRNKSSNHN